MAKIKIPTKEQRHEAGKARQKCPRWSHGKVIVGQGEKRDIVTIISYTDQAEHDYAAFVQAVRSGRLKNDLSPSRPVTALR